MCNHLEMRVAYICLMDLIIDSIGVGNGNNKRKHKCGR